MRFLLIAAACIALAQPALAQKGIGSGKVRGQVGAGAGRAVAVQPPVTEMLPGWVKISNTSVEAQPHMLGTHGTFFAYNAETPTQYGAGYSQLASNGAVRTACQYSFHAYVDPIVYPGQPGMSHLHVFYGNPDITPWTTSANIRSGRGNCLGGGVNKSGYWVAGMIDTGRTMPDGGHPVVTAGNEAGFYYKSWGSDHSFDPTVPIYTPPLGLKVITGNPSNTRATPQIANIAGWFCVAGPNSQSGLSPETQYHPDGGTRGVRIPNCPIGDTVEMSTNTPPCWDGVNLDSPGHGAGGTSPHMSYPIPNPNNPSGGYICPATHPVQIPTIVIQANWPVTADNAPSSRWQLSSDRYPYVEGDMGYSVHSDWFNGWNVGAPAYAGQAWNSSVEFDVLRQMVERCDAYSVDCHTGLLGDSNIQMTFPPQVRRQRK